MANNNASDVKNRLSAKKGLLSIVGAFLVNMVLNLMGKGVQLSQIINFINAWPVVVLGSALCLAYVIVERDRQKNKTIRAQNNSKDDEKEKTKLKERVKELENELAEIKKKRDQTALENGELKIKLEYMEKDVERLQQNNRAEVRNFHYIGERELK